MFDMFKLSFMQNAFIAGIIISILCPIIGLFIVLRRNSLIGETLSHSALAGVAIGLVCGFNPILTSFIYTSICAVIIELLRSHFKKYAELVMSIVLTLSLGIAIVLISTGKATAKVNSILFGSILTVSKSDLITIAICGFICLALIIIMYKKLIYVTFDEDGAKVSGINVKLINYIFSLLIGATISLSIQIMGALVISSILVVPVATAMQLKNNFKTTLIFSVLFGLFDIISGLFLSYYINSSPGGTIALTSVFMLVVVLIFARKRN